MAQIAVIGAGYVGLTTAACFSSLGHDVVCADIDEDRVERLSAGEIPIVEAGLEALVREGMEGGRHVGRGHFDQADVVVRHAFFREHLERVENLADKLRIER